MQGQTTTSIVARMGNVYWLLTGLLLGFGLLSIFSIGIPIFLSGLFAALYRVARVGGRGFWIVLVCMGALPAAYLTLRYLIADRATTFYPDNWWTGVLVYVGLGLVGVIWGLVETRHYGQHPRSEE